ncbi:TPA: hypothetical protein RUZ23_003144 [Vibrio cholerae]|uniref:hypothetical protein n=1 Tax=Vibrio cholerae TaxID=666 RepID=UPI000E656000|nr:hypothetical protein [Vibrio cholerae]EGQ9411448.1 hypothetical protein [Vibrio cholerae]EGR0490570.1 hypothetical protein [Vibrio cholerae]EGR0501924.1 hypothetical protein [Vibrio cholerae]EGR0589926.1 hypothetical protein [Vibrio cholerae]EGR1108671.1 hypothetical protein [Vibrio cholerae]
MQTFESDQEMGLGGAANDDWGDFSTVISQLESDEKSANDDVSSVVAEPAQSVSSEAFEGLLNVVFTISEQATSIISGIDFAFDEKGKAEVIKAAIPVINKHGSQLLGLFGNYIEEATLLLAVLALIYTSKRHVTQLKVLKAQQEAANGEKSQNTAQAA